MNHLIHLYSAGDDEGLILGALLGDFVKGRLDGTLPAPVEAGLALHRRIDSFAHTNRHFAAARRSLDPRFGHFRGILVDIFFDHFLAVEWEERTRTEYGDYLRRLGALLDARRQLLPPRLAELYPLIIGEWMPRYRSLSGVAEVLGRMEARTSRPSRLGEGAAELGAGYGGLQAAYGRFMADLDGFLGGAGLTPFGR